MTISLNRSEAVRKYFTSTPNQPKKPDYSIANKSIFIGTALLFIALYLLFLDPGFFILLCVLLGWFGIFILSNGFLALEKKKKYEIDLEQYKKDYAQTEPKPSDEQIDEWMDDDIDSIIEESCRKLDLEDGDYNTRPLVIGDPADLDETRYALGKDGKVRYSHLNVLIVYLTDHNILTYECVHTLIHG